jgi:hypothetical protein
MNPFQYLELAVVVYLTCVKRQIRPQSLNLSYVIEGEPLRISPVSGEQCV